MEAIKIYMIYGRCTTSYESHGGEIPCPVLLGSVENFYANNFCVSEAKDLKFVE